MCGYCVPSELGSIGCNNAFWHYSSGCMFSIWWFGGLHSLEINLATVTSVYYFQVLPTHF